MDRNPEKLWERNLRARGLVSLGAVALDYGADWERFVQWLSEGRHGSMGFLERHSQLRQAPEALFPGATGAFVVGLPYDVGDRLHAPRSRAAMYARFRDYHRVFKDALAQEAAAAFGGDQFRVLVDSAPVLERALAARTGAGFVGKNTCFIHPTAGSFLLLGEVLVRGVSVQSQQPWDSRERKDGQGCGPCRACQVVCPTGALDEDFRMDSKKCLSYWTIENRGTIPEEFWPHLATYWFGCDLCQLACPYNRPGPRLTAPSWFEQRSLPPLEEVAVMSQRQYEEWFGGTPLTRAKRAGLQRNALIALCVKGTEGLGEILKVAEAQGNAPVPQTVAQIRAYGRRRERQRLKYSLPDKSDTRMSSWDSP